MSTFTTDGGAGSYCFHPGDDVATHSEPNTGGRCLRPGDAGPSAGHACFHPSDSVSPCFHPGDGEPTGRPVSPCFHPIDDRLCFHPGDGFPPDDDRLCFHPGDPAAVAPRPVNSGHHPADDLAAGLHLSLTGIDERHLAVLAGNRP
jgi:hypothetical protein